MATNRLLGIAAGIAALLCVGCSDLGRKPGPGISGWIVLDPDIPTSKGLVFFERGVIHQGTFEWFTLAREDGYFEYELPVGGTWGVHIYYDNYFYMPIELEVREDFITPLEQNAIAWSYVRRGAWTGSGIQPDDPSAIAMIPDEDLSNNPRMIDPRVERVSDDLFRVSLTAEDPGASAEDPEPNLSVQQLAANEESGIGLALNAPGPPVDGVYPEGFYEANVYLPEGTDPNGPWWFVVSDMLCDNSSVVQVFPE